MSLNLLFSALNDSQLYLELSSNSKMVIRGGGEELLGARSCGGMMAAPSTLEADY